MMTACDSSVIPTGSTHIRCFSAMEECSGKISVVEVLPKMPIRRSSMTSWGWAKMLLQRISRRREFGRIFLSVDDPFEP